MYNTLIDYRKKISQICEQLIRIAEKIGYNNEADIIKQKAKIIFSRKGPSVMFYGLYNAGKSTLINAIFGQNIAPTGDIPTTREIQRIQWENFQIIDTPGINASNEHTLTAENEIILHDVILFVVDDMNIEEKSFYTSVVRVLKSGKPVIIVINEKNAETDSDLRSAKIMKLKTQIIENLRLVGKKEKCIEIENRKQFYGIFSVNAMAAYMAVQLSGNDRELLYRESGISELLSVIQDLLKYSEGVRSMLPLISVMEQSIIDIEKSIKENISAGNDKAYFGLIEKLVRLKNNLFQRLMREGKQEISTFGDMLMESAVSEKQSKKISGDELNSRLNDIIKRGFDEANIAISDQISLYNASVNCSFEPIIPSVTMPDRKEHSFARFDDFKSLNDAFKNVSTNFTTTSMSAPDPLKIIQIIILLLKNKSQKEAEERRRHEEQQRQIDENNRCIEQNVSEAVARIVEINRNIRSELLKLESSYTECITKMIEDTFEPLLEKLKLEHQKIETEYKEAECNLAELQKIQTELTWLKCEI